MNSSFIVQKMILIVGVLLLVPILGSEASSGLRRVCYYTNWAQYRSGLAKFLPQNIDVHLCTHIIYAYAKTEHNNLTETEWNDKAKYKEVISMKLKNPKLKILLSVSGTPSRAKVFSGMASMKMRRKEFIASAISLLRAYNFDGLDIAWQFPGHASHLADDKVHFKQLLMETRQAFDADEQMNLRPHLLLTASVSPLQNIIDRGYDANAFNYYLDFITIQSFTFHTGTESVLGHHSQLYPSSSEVGIKKHLNIEWAANYWSSVLGISQNKLNIGVATYGITFTLDNISRHNIGDPALRPGVMGNATRLAGFLSYYEICKDLDKGYTYWLNDAEVPYLVLGDQWIGFENFRSLNVKANWIKQTGYGGIGIWSLDLDDFNGICGGKKYPLITAVLNALR